MSMMWPPHKREDRIDALVLERLGHQVAAGNDARLTALALQRVFSGRRFPALICDLGAFDMYSSIRLESDRSAAVSGRP